MSCDFLALAQPGVRTLSPYQPGKPESELRRELGLSEIVKLASNENPLGPGEHALEGARQGLLDMGRYPDGAGFELRKGLATHLGVAPECLTLGNGSNDVLDMVARAFLAPGRDAVFSQHAFAVYPLVTQAAGGRARIAAANSPSHARPYGHDLDALREQVGPASRVVFIANPNNPTGTWVSVAELRAFLDGVPEQVIVVVDEAYVEYASDPAAASVVGALPDYPNLVVTRTFSKAYGLAALRVGYAVSSAAVADLLNRVRQPFNVSTVAQLAALGALEDNDHVRRSRDLNERERSRVAEALGDLGIRCLPSAGNFLCLALERDGGEVFHALLRRGVIVRPIGNYGLPEFLRVTVGTPGENTRFLEATKQVLAR